MQTWCIKKNSETTTFGIFKLVGGSKKKKKIFFKQLHTVDNNGYCT